MKAKGKQCIYRLGMLLPPATGEIYNILGVHLEKSPMGGGGGGGGKNTSEDILGGRVYSVHFEGLKSSRGGGGGTKFPRGIRPPPPK